VNAQDLKAVFESVPRVKLRVMKLLRSRNSKNQPPPGGWFPTDIDVQELGQAMDELIEYQSRCHQFFMALMTLNAIEVEASIPEYGL
jgi:hypothetical protein